jgi:hypothetical protein
MTVRVAAKRLAVGFNQNFTARPMGISGFKIQTAFAVVMQDTRIMKPRAPVFKRNRGFTIDAPVSFLQYTAGHLAPISVAFGLELILP